MCRARRRRCDARSICRPALAGAGGRSAALQEHNTALPPSFHIIFNRGWRCHCRAAARAINACAADHGLRCSSTSRIQHWLASTATVSSTRAAVCVTCIVIDNKPLRCCRIQSPDPIPAQFHTMLHTMTTIRMRLATMMMITFTMHNTNNHKIQTKHSSRTDLNPRRFCPKVGQIQRTLKLTMDLSAVSINNFKVLDT